MRVVFPIRSCAIAIIVDYGLRSPAALGEDKSHIKNLQESQTLFVMLNRWTENDEVDTIGVDSFRDGCFATRHLLHVRPRLSALLQRRRGTTANEGRLRGFLKVIAIPRHVFMVAFDDPGFASYHSPPLTAVELPVEKESNARHTQRVDVSNILTRQ